ncbi:MAG: IS66 family transposase [Bacteroidetes bacterium]|nr:IS66 family transposase [Bacteroidota bacterium]
MSNSTTSTPSYTELLSVIERQERVIAQQEQVIARQEATIKQLNGRIKELEHKVDELEEKVQHLEGELAKKDLRIEELVKQLYGKSSEKDKSKRCGGKRGTRAHSRDGFNDDNEHNNDYPDHLPRIEEFVDNLPDGANPDDYQLIGERRVPRLATLPVLHYVLVTIHRTYKKKSNSYIPPRKPEHEHPLGKCSADISFVVFAVIQKILFHIPFYRLEKLLELQGIACRRSNLVRWSERLADLLEIIAGAILQDIKGAAVVYGDESPAVVNIKKGEESSEYKRTYFWNLVAPDRGVFFHWTEKRNQKEAKQLLAGIQGTFVSDALEIYDHATSKLSLSWAICWIHIRRNFLKTTSNKELAEQALGRINTILAIDKAIRAATKNDSDIQRRLQYRQRFLSPLVDGMRQWICTHINTPAVQTDDLMLKAFNYIDRRWEEATCFIREPLVLPHNNIPEQHFRFLKIGAKNWLFCASECGAKTLTTLYTLLYSAKLLNINPSVYLNDIIKQIDVQGVTPNQLVPRVWKEHREKIATENYFKNHRQTAKRTGNT